jgi:hypothetical protein
METEQSIKQQKEEDILASKNTDVSKVRVVCLALGPYRNLTTLTASILFLHPNCQVLNHAGLRIFNDDRLDFLKGYSARKFENFLRYAIHISQAGQRGTYGGSITFSHAFDDEHAMKKVFETSGNRLLKEDARALFWKESLVTANHIRENATNLEGIFRENERLRFLLPVRNPIDCAFSNLKTGHVQYFRSVNERSTVEQVLEAILDEFAWFESLRAKSPGRFFTFFEHEFGTSTLEQLAIFLELPTDEGWVQNAMRAFEIKKHYEVSPALSAFYRQRVESKFAPYPEFKEKLLAFIPRQ